jgi:hypothetical protein
MKPTLFSKSVRTIALIIAIASTGLQQPASAQAQNACSIALAQDRGTLDGIDLTPTQSSAFNAFSKRYDAVVVRFQERAKKVIKPNAPVLFFSKEGTKIPSKLQEALSIAAEKAKPAQIPSLTAKYSQYGRFVPETTFVYSQALFEEYGRAIQIVDDQSLVVMNPTQRQKYRQNRAAEKKSNQVCGNPYGAFVKVGNAYEIGGSYF